MHVRMGSATLGKNQLPLMDSFQSAQLRRHRLERSMRHLAASLRTSEEKITGNGYLCAFVVSLPAEMPGGNGENYSPLPQFPSTVSGVISALATDRRAHFPRAVRRWGGT
jgi:hypothetical protein